MKRTRFGIFGGFVLAVVVVEEVLRHVLAGSSIVASILSSRTGDFSWQLLVAGVFILVRVFALWILPALVVVRVGAWLWKGLTNRSDADGG
jgi:hypothetical protein